MKWHLTDEERGALSKKHSKNAKERWADPEMRALMTARQSAGTTAAWADPEKAKLRLERREQRARDLGFDDYGQLAAYTHLKNNAKKCGVDVDDYIKMTSKERKELRIAKGLSKSRRKKK